MSSLRAIWSNGQIILEGQADWPEGRRLIIQEEVLPSIHFMTEEEQRDTPAAIQEWIEDLRTIPPVPSNLTQERDLMQWDDLMRDFNVQAIADQFKKGVP